MLKKVVILAGGKGTRLRPFSFVIPKPLLPIGEDPILLHLINRFKKSNITSFLISTGYQAELVRAYFGDGSRFGVKIKYFHEEKPLGTAGPLTLMRKEFVDDEYIFLINGDIYTELNFENMVMFANEHKYDLVVGYVEKIEKSSFGVLDVSDGQINRIIEKPETSYSISSGIYVMKSGSIRFIPDNEYFTMPDLINSFLSRGEKVGAYKIEDFWIGIENADNLDTVLKRIDGVKS
ncbi:MAG: NTP transferase domain-containing protein [Nitrospinae bacterium]|nr:NTP transferase domain-containing protein [Nitrospinota bacterium]MBF0633107.1 NTP transferase domain-containing protein [Nitrospinota bacterium]